jgi:hypothetical protein
MLRVRREVDRQKKGSAMWEKESKNAGEGNCVHQ